MRTLGGFCVVLLAAGSLIAQNRSGFVTPVPVVRSFGSVVQPGSSSGFSGVQRTTGSVIFPGGSTQIGIPGIPPATPNFSSGRLGAVPQQNLNRGGHRGGGAIYSYPVYVPSYYDNSYYNGGTLAPMTQPQQQQPNVTVIYPPQHANPVIINMGPQDLPQQSIYEPAPRQQSSEQPAEPTHFLLAFKDHSIYSAIAYWVDGDTVHYFTSGNTHNQASVSLIDRELTERLNRESGNEVKLPPVK